MPPIDWTTVLVAAVTALGAGGVGAALVSAVAQRRKVRSESQRTEVETYSGALTALQAQYEKLLDRMALLEGLRAEQVRQFEAEKQAYLKQFEKDKDDLLRRVEEDAAHDRAELMHRVETAESARQDLVSRLEAEQAQRIAQEEEFNVFRNQWHEERMLYKAQLQEFFIGIRQLLEQLATLGQTPAWVPDGADETLSLHTPLPPTVVKRARELLK
jgi:hypothetical protein